MAKTKKIKFELLVVTDNDRRRNSWKPPDFLISLIVSEAYGFIKRLFIIAVVIFVYAIIVYSDDLIKRIMTWFINIIKGI